MGKFKSIGVVVLLSLLSLTARAQSEGSPTLGTFGEVNLELQDGIEIYPNPAVDFVNVELRESSLRDVEFYIHNIIGNKINIAPEKTSTNNFRFDLKDLPPGYYLLSVKDRNQNFNKTYKFLKK